jgi:glycosyltransferase involved in cell wall biosynthesis
VNEYLALGKAMVIDEVSDLAKFLKENDAALVCDPDSEEEFSENIRMLLNDANLRNRLSFNAKKLAHDFTWEKQAAKLASVLGL